MLSLAVIASVVSASVGLLAHVTVPSAVLAARLALLFAGAVVAVVGVLEQLIDTSPLAGGPVGLGVRPSTPLEER